MSPFKKKKKKRTTRCRHYSEETFILFFYANQIHTVTRHLTVAAARGWTTNIFPKRISSLDLFYLTLCKKKTSYNVQPTRHRDGLSINIERNLHHITKIRAVPVERARTFIRSKLCASTLYTVGAKVFDMLLRIIIFDIFKKKKTILVIVVLLYTKKKKCIKES